MNIEKYLNQKRKLINRALLKYLPSQKDYPQTMARAMRYSLLVGGKRIRPILVLAAAEAVGGAVQTVLPTAVAIELIHTYSLIHDDLPAMDNDDFRRGQPTSHKVFGEALAILAGDALMTRAYEIIARHTDRRKVSPARILEVICEIGQATGLDGMVGGQAVDLISEGKKVTPEVLNYIHSRKTAALIICALRCGAIISGAGSRSLKALTDYGRHLGLAFQIVDDILDVEGSTEKLGKTAGKDVRSKKVTYPAVWGLRKAKKKLAAVLIRAEKSLKILGPRGLALKELLNFIAEREK